MKKKSPERELTEDERAIVELYRRAKSGQVNSRVYYCEGHLRNEHELPLMNRAPYPQCCVASVSTSGAKTVRVFSILFEGPPPVESG